MIETHIDSNRMNNIHFRVLTEVGKGMKSLDVEGRTQLNFKKLAADNINNCASSREHYNKQH